MAISAAVDFFADEAWVERWWRPSIMRAMDWLLAAVFSAFAVRILFAHP